MTRINSTRHVLVLGLALVALGCEAPSQGITLPLSATGSSGSTFVLQGARFRIRGPSDVTLVGDDTFGTTLSANLPAGAYTVELRDGWTLVRLPDGTPMDAALVSPNPQMATVFDGASTRVTFAFRVLGETVVTGGGGLEVGFEVDEGDAGMGVADAGVDADAGSADSDGDGFPSGVDCDDLDPMVNPMAPERCDGRDDDCDGAIDEGFACAAGDMQVCTTVCGTNGTRACDPMACVYGACQPPAETCNGVDDDCDAIVDEGACGGCMPTAESCNGVDDDCDLAVDEGACGGCMPSPEMCDGLDNDCDLAVDEGACGGCVPSPEVCDAIDNDCDAMVDEAVFGGACGTDVGQCSSGMRSCQTGVFVCVGEVGPTAETCNGLDDDCDGMTDEGNPGGGGACGTSTGACEFGTQQCVGGALTCVGGVGPVMETCNGLDDDCDGVSDEGNPGGGAACGSDVGECTAGTLLCTGPGGLVCAGAGGPTAESCNGLDDDCDGAVDESACP